MSLLQILKEVRNEGVLYHFTHIDSLYQILETNTLKSSGSYNFISLTRKYNLSEDIEHFGECRITFDKNKLKKKYSIKNHNDPYYQDTKSNIYRYEAEEIINKNILSVKNYILSIDINEKFFEQDPNFYDSGFENFSTNEYIQMIEELSPVKVNIVREWQPYRKL